MKKIYVSKNERRHMGGWSSYCSFYEIFDDKGKLVVQVNEEDGTVVLPHQESFDNKIFSREYKGKTIPITLLDFNEKFLTVKIHNLHDTIKKLYYYPPKWKKLLNMKVLQKRIMMIQNGKILKKLIFKNKK